MPGSPTCSSAGQSWPPTSCGPWTRSDSRPSGLGPIRSWSALHFACMEPSGGPGAAVLRPGGETDATGRGRAAHDRDKRGFLASLGPRFLTRLYRRVALFDGSFLLIADVRGTSGGFIAGALDVGAFYKTFLLHDGLLAALGSAPRLVRAWPRALETLRHGSNEKPESGTAELLSVAVDPRARARSGHLVGERFLGRGTQVRGQGRAGCGGGGQPLCDIPVRALEFRTGRRVRAPPRDEVIAHAAVTTQTRPDMKQTCADMRRNLAVLAGALSASVVATRVASATARKLGIVDSPGLLKPQSEPVAYLGGLGVLAGTAVGVAATGRLS